MSQGSCKTWMFSTGLFHPSSSPSSLPLNRSVCHCNRCEEHLWMYRCINLISRFLFTEKASARGFCNSWNWALQICGRAMGWWNMMPILDLPFIFLLKWKELLSFKIWTRTQPAVDPKPIFGKLDWIFWLFYHMHIDGYIPSLLELCNLKRSFHDEILDIFLLVIKHGQNIYFLRFKLYAIFFSLDVSRCLQYYRFWQKNLHNVLFYLCFFLLFTYYSLQFGVNISFAFLKLFTSLWHCK